MNEIIEMLKLKKTKTPPGEKNEVELVLREYINSIQKAIKSLAGDNKWLKQYLEKKYKVDDESLRDINIWNNHWNTDPVRY